MKTPFLITALVGLSLAACGSKVDEAKEKAKTEAADKAKEAAATVEAAAKEAAETTGQKVEDAAEKIKETVGGESSDGGGADSGEEEEAPGQP